jgi:16S rRNA (guanine527-N7)-methyltransferase
VTSDLAVEVSRLLERPVSEAAIGRFGKYIELLQKWQKSVRLVGSADRAWLIENVILDSLLFLRVLPLDVRNIADLGAGAGVPGIPLAIALPDVAVTLIEVRQKRLSFLAQVIRELGLTTTTLVGARVTATDIPDSLSGAFDAVVIRCAGSLAAVLPAAQRLACDRGVVIASGPPEEHQLVSGRWVSVPGARPGTVRRFAVVAAA